nr:DUF3012 domain-containing protein [Photobacterium leiognathi]
MKKLLVLLGAVTLLTACSPEVGSEDWCNQLKEKPKGDWTANEATEFAKAALFASVLIAKNNKEEPDGSFLLHHSLNKIFKTTDEKKAHQMMSFLIDGAQGRT